MIGLDFIRLGRLRQRSGMPLSPVCRALLDALIPFAGEMAGKMNARSLAMTVWAVARIASLEGLKIPPLPAGRNGAIRSWDGEEWVGESQAISIEGAPPNIRSIPAGSVNGEAGVASVERGPSGSWSRAADTAEGEPSITQGLKSNAVDGHACGSSSSIQSGAGEESETHTSHSSQHMLASNSTNDSSANEDERIPRSQIPAGYRQGTDMQPSRSSSEHRDSEQPEKNELAAHPRGEVGKENDGHPVASTSGRDSEATSGNVPQLVAPQARRRVLRRKASSGFPTECYYQGCGCARLFE